jgi:4-amino-4-deoxy-L-arabinose transferase-like glycosyltransferase
MAYWNNLLTGFSAALVLIFFLFKLHYLAVGYRNPSSIWLPISSNLVFRLFNQYCFLIILLLAALIRVWDFGSVPAGFNQDGAMAAVDAKALADYGTDRFGMKYPVHFTAWGYGQMSVLLSYLMVPFIKVAGLNEITARLPILIVSLIGLLAFYGLIKNLLGRTAGLIALFLITINPWHIMQSRWALDCNLFPHFFLIACYFLYMATFRKIYLLCSMISFALCMYSYGVAFLTVPLFLGLIVIYSLWNKIFQLKDIVLGGAVYLLVSAPIWAVMIINFLRLPSIETPLFTIPFFPDSVRSGDILFFSENLKEQFIHNLNAFQYVVLKQGPDLPWNAIDNFGTYYQFSLPFVLLGLILAIKRSFLSTAIQEPSNPNQQSSFRFIYFMLLSGLIIGIWTGLVIASVNVNRINIIFYFIVLLMTLGVYEIIKSIRSVGLLLVPLYFVFFILFCQYYYGTWAREIGPYYFSGMADALKEAKKIDTPRYYITVNSQGHGAKTVSEILTLFHHRVDAKYFQGANFSADEKTLSAETISGNKYGLPYSERYRYIDPSLHQINPSEQAVYIVNAEERRLFNPYQFKIISFEGYALVAPVSLSIDQ